MQTNIQLKWLVVESDFVGYDHNKIDHIVMCPLARKCPLGVCRDL